MLGLGLGLDSVSDTLIVKLLCTRISAALGCNCHGPQQSCSDIRHRFLSSRREHTNL